MSELRELCERLGFRDVRTYIASGNVIFDADGDEASVRVQLAAALAERAGKPVGVVVRTAAELEAVIAYAPYPERPRNLVHVIFLEHALTDDVLAGASGIVAEEITAGRREVYVYYPLGQGASKLKLPATSRGTARNMNTVAKLDELAGSRAATGDFAPM